MNLSVKEHVNDAIQRSSLIIVNPTAQQSKSLISNPSITGERKLNDDKSSEVTTSKNLQMNPRNVKS